MEELLLEALLVLDELDVVDEQDVAPPVAALEGAVAVGADGVDEVVQEVLGGDVAHAHRPGSCCAHVVADGVQEVGLAQPGVAVDEQRVVGPGRLLGHGQGGGVGEAVGLADDEGLEGVVGVEADLAQGPEVVAAGRSTALVTVVEPPAEPRGRGRPGGSPEPPAPLDPEPGPGPGPPPPMDATAGPPLPALRSPTGMASSSSPAARASSVCTSRTTSWGSPATSLTTSATKPRYRLSIRSLASGLGTARNSRWSSRARGRAEASQVFQMPSGTSLRSTPTHAPHNRRSAPARHLPWTFSTALSTDVDKSTGTGFGRGAATCRAREVETRSPRAAPGEAADGSTGAGAGHKGRPVHVRARQASSEGAVSVVARGCPVATRRQFSIPATARVAQCRAAAFSRDRSLDDEEAGAGARRGGQG